MQAPSPAGAGAEPPSTGRRLLVPIAHTGARTPATVLTPAQHRRLLSVTAKARDYARWPSPPRLRAPPPQPSSSVVVPATRVLADTEGTPRAGSSRLLPDPASAPVPAPAPALASASAPASASALSARDEARVAERAPTIDTLLPSGTGSLFQRSSPVSASTTAAAPHSSTSASSSASTPSTASSTTSPHTRSTDTLGSFPPTAGGPPSGTSFTSPEKSQSSSASVSTEHPPKREGSGDTQAHTPLTDPSDLKPRQPDHRPLGGSHSRTDSTKPSATAADVGQGQGLSQHPAFTQEPRDVQPGAAPLPQARALVDDNTYVNAAAAEAAAGTLTMAATVATPRNDIESPPILAAAPGTGTKDGSRFNDTSVVGSTSPRKLDENSGLASNNAQTFSVGPADSSGAGGATPHTATAPERSQGGVAPASIPPSPRSRIRKSLVIEPPRPPPSLPATAWVEVQEALDKFRQRCSARANTAVAPPLMEADRLDMEKAGPLRNVLLPFLQNELERPGVYSVYVPPGTPAHDPAVKASVYMRPENRRYLFFEWLSSLLAEIPHVATSSDRGAVLESLACLLESENLSAAALHGEDSSSTGSSQAHTTSQALAIDRERYSSLLSQACEFAIGEMNKKGVYQNTLIFSGRVLAIALFRIESVATKLLRHLPVSRFSIDRLANEIGWHEIKPQTDQEWGHFTALFPSHLRAHCYRDTKSYLSNFEPGGRGRARRPAPGTSTASMHPGGSANASGRKGAELDDHYLINRANVKVEMGGNWLRRWQSDDSELFFSFCRNFHRQLARLLYGAARQGPEIPIMRLQSEPRLVFGVPGYAHINASIHQKCLSLVQRELMSVTTLSSQKSPFNAGETANVLVGASTGKPRHLDLANRRCSAVVVESVRVCGTQGPIFLPMIDTQIKTLFRRTSLWDIQGVFCLLDWTDSLFAAIQAADWEVEEVVDLGFILDVMEMLLVKSDHAVTVMRTISYAYSNFGLLTASKANRMRFTEGMLLKTDIFQKLFLSWSFLIRAYFLHLLVFRLGHLTDFPPPPEDPRNTSAMYIAQLFNQRLDEIRERHDELSPDLSSPSDTEEEGEEGEEDGRSRRRLSFVSTIKRARSIERSPSLDSLHRSSDEEDDVAKADEWDVDPDPQHVPVKSTASRAAKWLRSMRKTKSPSSKSSPGSGSPNDPHFQSSANRTNSSHAFKEFEERGEAQASSTPDDPKGLRKVSSSPSLSGQQNDTSLRRRSSSSSDRISFDATFDLQTAHPPPTLPPAGMGGPASGRPSSIRSSHSRVSRAFSKRSSLVPGPAFDLVAALGETDSVIDDTTSASGSEVQSLMAPGGAGGGGASVPASSVPVARTNRAKARYAPNLHVYAVQSLREYETTIHEHDDFISAQPEGERSIVPALPVNWPALWNDPS